MKLNEWISSRWNSYIWGGNKKAPMGEGTRAKDLDLDFASPFEPPISTKVDCYVTGTYIADGGKIFTIRERYTVDISYSNSTILEATARIRQSIMDEFQKDNPNFNVSDIFVDELKRMFSPKPEYMFKGGRMFRAMTRIERGKVTLGTHKDIYRSNAHRIIKKFGIRRSEGNIKL